MNTFCILIFITTDFIVLSIEVSHYLIERDEEGDSSPHFNITKEALERKGRNFEVERIVLGDEKIENYVGQDYAKRLVQADEMLKNNVVEDFPEETLEDYANRTVSADESI